MGKLILTSEKYGVKEVLYDDCDLEVVSSYKWYVFTNPQAKTWYVKGYRKGSKPHTFFIHRKILGLTDPKTSVDHINGNGLDNRRCNLRTATHSENMRNRRPQKNTTGFKGVFLLKNAKKNPYMATISCNYKSIHIGCYSTPEIAAKAYNEKAISLFGDFACINQGV